MRRRSSSSSRHGGQGHRGARPPRQRRARPPRRRLHAHRPRRRPRRRLHAHRRGGPARKPGILVVRVPPRRTAIPWLPATRRPESLGRRLGRRRSCCRSHRCLRPPRAALSTPLSLPIFLSLLGLLSRSCSRPRRRSPWGSPRLRTGPRGRERAPRLGTPAPSTKRSQLKRSSGSRRTGRRRRSPPWRSRRTRWRRPWRSRRRRSGRAIGRARRRPSRGSSGSSLARLSLGSGGRRQHGRRSPVASAIGLTRGGTVVLPPPSGGSYERVAGH